MSTTIETTASPASLLATAADHSGLWCADAARWADVLEPVGLTPSDCTPDVVAEAEAIRGSRLRRLAKKLRERNERITGQADITPTAQRHTISTAAAEPIVRKTPKRKKTGKRVLVFDKYSITAVLRWCGANGWSFDDTATAVETVTISKVNDITIRLQLKAGKDGKRGAPAPLTESEVKTLKNATL